MKHKTLAYSILPVLSLGLLTTNVASAHGFFGGFANLPPEEMASRQQSAFQNEATILGISVDEVKAAWAEGKTIKQIMEEKGIDQKQVQDRMKAAHIAQMKIQLQALVDKGIISQAQADKRLEVMQNRQQNGKERMGKSMFRGFRF